MGRAFTEIKFENKVAFFYKKTVNNYKKVMFFHNYFESTLIELYLRGRHHKQASIKFPRISKAFWTNTHYYISVRIEFELWYYQSTWRWNKSRNKRRRRNRVYYSITCLTITKDEDHNICNPFIGFLQYWLCSKSTKNR